QQKESKEIDPLTTQAGSAIARSSRPRSCKQSSQGQGRQKFANQLKGAVPPLQRLCCKEQILHLI
ncbi:hypothetical protein PISMIDRAFT_114059, partial [Pisolithus microcarpus 441]